MKMIIKEIRTKKSKKEEIPQLKLAAKYNYLLFN
jgi:hypothetical protein